MAPEERRYTADEWREIQTQYREQPRRGIRTMYPDPEDDRSVDAFVPEGAYSPSRGRGAQHQPHPHHVEVWIATLSAEDITKLETLLALRPETVKWVSEKNSRELDRLDGAVEFISSSRTAAKVLMWVCGVAVTCVTGSIGLAKAGIDAFALFRGVGK